MSARRRWVFGAVAAVSIMGCGRGEQPRPVPARVLQPASANSVVEPEEAEIDDPAESFSRLFSGLSEGRTEAVVAAVPWRYRQDIDHFLADAVQPIAPTERQNTAQAIARLASVLETKQHFVVGSSRLELSGPAADFVRTRFASLCRLTARIAEWSGWTTPDAGDAASLIKTSALAISNESELVDALRSVSFETVDRAGGRATIRMAVRGGSEPREFSAVRIDGVWVPQFVAERWESLLPARPVQDRFEDAVTEAADFAERLDSISESVVGVATQSEFDALVEQAATLLLANAATDQAPRPVEPSELVTVDVIGGMTDEEKDRLVWELTSRTDDASSGIADAVDRSDGRGITVTVGPVTDLQAFAGRLTGLQVEAIDDEQKRVTARFAGP